MALVTLGLVCTGAIAGAILGVLIVTFGIVRVASTAEFSAAATVLLLGAAFGGVLGAILAPFTGWVLLRRVPLGRAVGGTFLGSMIGAFLGVLAGPNASIWGALTGFGAAAVWMRAHLSEPGARRLSTDPAAERADEIDVRLGT